VCAVCACSVCSVCSVCVQCVQCVQCVWACCTNGRSSSACIVQVVQQKTQISTIHPSMGDWLPRMRQKPETKFFFHIKIELKYSQWNAVGLTGSILRSSALGMGACSSKDATNAASPVQGGMPVSSLHSGILCSTQSSVLGRFPLAAPKAEEAKQQDEKPTTLTKGESTFCCTNKTDLCGYSHTDTNCMQQE